MEKKMLDNLVYLTATMTSDSKNSSLMTLGAIVKGKGDINEIFYAECSMYDSQNLDNVGKEIESNFLLSRARTASSVIRNENDNIFFVRGNYGEIFGKLADWVKQIKELKSTDEIRFVTSLSLHELAVLHNAIPLNELEGTDENILDLRTLMFSIGSEDLVKGRKDEIRSTTIHDLKYHNHALNIYKFA